MGSSPFADTADTRLELSELSEDLILPTLATRGRGTSYASALEALRHTIPADIALLKASGLQVHRPAVFFLSDGQPTEKEAKWKERLAELKDPAFNERPNILAFGVGDADPKVIQQLATSPAHALMMREGVSTEGAIAEFAASMLHSMVSSAERLDRSEQTLEFEKPEGFVKARRPARVAAAGDGSARAAAQRRAGGRKTACPEASWRQLCSPATHSAGARPTDHRRTLASGRCPARGGRALPA